MGNQGHGSQCQSHPAMPTMVRKPKPNPLLLMSPKTRSATIIAGLENPLGSAGTLALGRKTGRPVTYSGFSDGLNVSLLFAWDKLSGYQFLVDTGVEVSVLPATGLDTRIGQSDPSLKAANGSSIKTYGVRTIQLRLASCQY